MRAVALCGPRTRDEHVAFCHTEGAELVRGESVAGFDAALIFGGDGTIHRYLPQVVAAKTPTLVVPVGSGNDFAVGLGIRALSDAAAAWKKYIAGGNNAREIDVARIAWQGGESLFCCVGGLGLDALANSYANRMPHPLRRSGGYVLAAMMAIIAYHAQRITVTGRDGEQEHQIAEPAMMMAFANAPTYGDGMQIAPGAKLDDGKLDICFVRRVNKLKLLRLFPRVFSGTHMSLQEVDFFRASSLRIESERPTNINADGEFICQTPAEVTVLPKALRVIIP